MGVSFLFSSSLGGGNFCFTAVCLEGDGLLKGGCPALAHPAASSVMILDKPFCFVLFLPFSYFALPSLFTMRYSLCSRHGSVKPWRFGSPVFFCGSWGVFTPDRRGLAAKESQVPVSHQVAEGAGV